MSALFWFLLSCTALAHDMTPLDRLLNEGIAARIFPGAVVLITHEGKVIHRKAYGRYTYDEDAPVMTTETLFDIASLTKVVATTTLAMMLFDRGLLDLKSAVGDYIPAYAAADRADIRVKHLLTHTSGIQEQLITTPGMSREELWDTMLHYPVDNTGVEYRYTYTCTNMILLQHIIECITGASFRDLTHSWILEPVAMHHTCFCPADRSRCAPTRGVSWRGDCIQGVVEDDRAFILGCIAGNAGLFSTADDLARFMAMILGGGVAADGRQLIDAETIRSWTTQQCAFKRGYGWELGRHLSEHAFGHFGWTGTSIWADHERKLCCILLTNRTYLSDGPERMRIFREQFHEMVMAVLVE